MYVGGDYVVYRTNEDGTESVIACVSEEDIGTVIGADRDNIDWEATYSVRPE